MTNIDALKQALSNSLKTAELRDATISRLEMQIRALRAIETPTTALHHILDFALAAGYPNEEHLDEVAAFLDTLEE